jgi:hypothetical protein
LLTWTGKGPKAPMPWGGPPLLHPLKNTKDDADRTVASAKALCKVLRDVIDSNL